MPIFVQVNEQSKNQSNIQTNQSFIDSLKSTLTNISYNIKNSEFIFMPFITRKSIQIEQKDYAMALLLGKSYSFENKTEFEERFNKTIWMSYRNLNDQGDVGWGCMIRVVQMVFAEVFQRHFPKAKASDLIKLFKDECQGPFCLSKICKLGRIERRFASSPQIYSIMSSLVQENQHRLSINLSIQNYSNTIYIKNQNQYTQHQFPKLISVLASAHQDQQKEKNFQEQYLNHLLSVMKESSFCGIAAGVNNQALFIVGEYKQLAIILDPHYVQSEQKQQTYFQKTPKGVEFTKLKSSFTINFYLKDIHEFGEWVDNMMLMDKIWAPSNCFRLSIKNPEGWIKNHRKKSEDFEILI